MSNREKINWLLLTLAGISGVVAAYMQGGWVAAMPAITAALGTLAGINGYVATKAAPAPTAPTPEQANALITKLAGEFAALDQAKKRAPEGGQHG